MMGNKRRFTLCARREIVKTMGLPENLKSDGFPNLYKLSKSVDEGGLGIDRKTLKNWWKNRDNDKTRHKQKRFRVDNLVQKGQYSEMEQELNSWIENGRAKGACLSGFAIRVKALEIMREQCRRDNKPLVFKASAGWLFNFLKRNKWVLRRITTSGRDLPDNSIETILNFLNQLLNFLNLRLKHLHHMKNLTLKKSMKEKKS